jgi:hypothetical protein
MYVIKYRSYNQYKCHSKKSNPLRNATKIPNDLAYFFKVCFSIISKLILCRYAQGRTGHCGNCREAFFENVRLFLKNVWYFKDIFRKIAAILKWFEFFFKDFNSFRRYFQRNVRLFQRLRGFLNTY